VLSFLSLYELLRSYKLRKDNTVAYRGNFYTVPLGTYRDQTTQIYLVLS